MKNPEEAELIDDKPTPKELLKKSKESVLSAVQIYNNPLSKFRTESYIVHMMIAWNSLLQATFLNKGQEIYEKDRTGHYIVIEDRKKTISTEKLMSQYFTDNRDPVYLNLDFIIKLRNEIEHAVYVDIEKVGIDLFGECQSLLLNYEETLIREFGEGEMIQNKIGLSIQFSKQLSPEQLATQIEPMKSYNLNIKKFIEAYRDGISTDIYNDDRYRLSIYMVPKVSNNKHKNDIPVIFDRNVKIDVDEIKSGKVGFMTVKYESVKVPSRDFFKLKPSDVVRLVKEQTGRTNFTITQHIKCWVKYEARPRGKDPSIQNDWCMFDEAHGDYVYSQKWVDFLADKFQYDDEYNAIIESKLEYKN